MKKSLLVLIISLNWGKKIFKTAHQNPNAIVWAHTDATFWAVRYLPPPESHPAFHIYYVKYENTLTCKRISWDWGGGSGGGRGRGMTFKKYFSFSYMYNTKSDHFSPKIKPDIHGNRKSNAIS